MDSFRENLKSIIEQDYIFSCYAIKTKKTPLVGTKVYLSSEQIHDFLNRAIGYLCDKVYSQKQLGDYPEASPKEFIEMLSCSDDRVKDFCATLNNIVANPELNNTALTHYNAYMLSSIIENIPCHFITSKNPFVSYQKRNQIYALVTGKKYKVIDTDIVRLIMHFDCIVFQGQCYFVTMQGKQLFGLEQNAIQKSHQEKDKLFDRAILSTEGEGILERYMKKSGKASCLSYTDSHILEELENITAQNWKQIEKKYKLKIKKDIDGSFRVDVSTEEQLKDFIDTITDKRGLDFDNNIVTCKAPFTRRAQ